MEDTTVSEVENVSKDVPLEGSKVQEVIGLLLAPPKSDDDCQDSIQQVDFPIASEQEAMTVNGSTIATISISTSPLNISQVTLGDAGIPLLEHGDVIQRTLEAHAVQLEDGTTAFVQTLAAEDESDSSDVPTKFIDGQAVQLEDGTTAFIHTAPREGLQAVQLEDGTMAYLSQAGAELFDGEASGLGLEQLTSPQISVENHDDKESLGIKVTVGIIENANHRLTSTKAMGEKTFRCPYEGCSRLYTTQHHLKVHERSHTGDRPFKCVVPGCGKAFATGYGLKSHTRVHTGETPYRCPEESCNKAFKTSGDLQKHVRTHTGERPFKCPFEGCDRAFTTSNIRKVHIRTHTGERPYVCKEDGCGRAFASATNFKNHIRIHTGEKPYVCTVQGCGKRFTEYSSLYKHHVVHTHSKPYICNLCGKNYRQTSTLAMHKRTVHGIVDGNDDCVLDSSVAAVEDRALNIKDEEDFEHVNKKSRIEFQLGTDIEEGTNLVIQSANAQQRPVYAVQVQQDVGLPSPTQQILVVADPSQLVALQQFAQQAQLENVLTQPDIQSDGDVVSE